MGSTASAVIVKGRSIRVSACALVVAVSLTPSPLCLFRDRRRRWWRWAKRRSLWRGV